MLPDYTPSPAEDWLRENWTEVEIYNFQWVAVGSRGIIDHRSDLSALMERVERLGLQDEAIYTFVNFPQEIGEGGL